MSLQSTWFKRVRPDPFSVEPIIDPKKTFRGWGKSLFISLPVFSTIKKNTHQEDQGAGQERRNSKTAAEN